MLDMMLEYYKCEPTFVVASHPMIQLLGEDRHDQVAAASRWLKGDGREYPLPGSLVR